MIGTLLNVGGILVGGLVGLARRKPLSPATENFLKVSLGALTVYFGLRLTWQSFSGSWYQILKELLISVLALMLGKLLGRLMRLQQFSNGLGRGARDRITSAKPGDPARSSQGFKTCAALFCAAPLGILGAVQDGLSGYFPPLVMKMVMDGLAAMGFVSLFGWGVLLAALPVFVFQGSITLACSSWVAPLLHQPGAAGLLESINSVGGLLVFSVALVMLGIKKIELADYLPALVVAPLITWIWK